ncbi:MAG: bifunctional phosphopantothenoylcysteine decarboxylase/phosphopantothenate--cysteine ligase CoaBC [Acidimicrobiia bacterium]|nr:bifunctional phosphopantothenoylcysteine decarboxylase/phosphopantothenate--cysteine ligase CoaBC [Acidimicrobiia bacterium]
MQLAGRRIVLGITGGIAAYKSAHLARLLVQAGAQVRCVMTESALRFLGPATLSAITGTPPARDFWEEPSPAPHLDLARWADAVCIAPATAATMARLAHGLSEDLLSAVVLAARVPVVVAPAMHSEMWSHPATRRNLASLLADGVTIVGPASGPLAGGDSGPGRMVEPEEIFAAMEKALGGGALAGWRVLVTAGGTREPIDPVRFVGNRSSGKMGNAIAEEAASRGAAVTLVTAAAPPAARGIEVVPVETAQEMAEAVWSRAGAVDVAVMAAAVADFRPASPAAAKLRRAAGPPELVLEPTPDILAGVAAMRPRPFLVGFAAETGPVEGAVPKAVAKGVDLLVANDVSAAGSGFGTEDNRVALILPDGTLEAWESLPKRRVAARLWERIAELRSRGTP